MALKIETISNFLNYLFGGIAANFRHCQFDTSHSVVQSLPLGSTGPLSIPCQDERPLCYRQRAFLMRSLDEAMNHKTRSRLATIPECRREAKVSRWRWATADLELAAAF